jgi:hypothetical protein
MLSVILHTSLYGVFMESTQLTRNRLCELLDVDTEKGIFVWKHTMGGKAKKGQEAGALTANGYVAIRVDQQDYLAHRLMWLYVYGAFPIINIDHIDRNKTNNSATNLRLASPKQNAENMSLKSTNSSGHRGVYHRKYLKTNPFSVNIMHNRKTIHIGYFATVEEAVEARKKAEDKYFTHHTA